MAEASPPTQPWTDEELGYLQDNSDLTARELGRRLGRGMQSVQHKRNQLRNGWSFQREHWTTEDTDFVRQTPHFTAAQVAHHLSRSVSSILNRRYLLSRTEGIDFDGAKSPFMIGARRLLARTCPDCGYLLQASWFGFDRTTNGHGAWRTLCRRCRQNRWPAKRMPGSHAMRKDGVDSARFAEARLQALTLPRAVNHRAPWLAEHHVILSDPDLTVVEKAIALGRTYQATMSMCSKSGYASRKGLGDPVNGQWFINNPNAGHLAS